MSGKFAAKSGLCAMLHAHCHSERQRAARAGSGARDRISILAIDNAKSRAEQNCKLYSAGRGPDLAPANDSESV
eukprot:4597405-Pleurochrysis_carterae.AAC.1